MKYTDFVTFGKDYEKCPLLIARIHLKGVLQQGISEHNTWGDYLQFK